MAKSTGGVWGVVRGRQPFFLRYFSLRISNIDVYVTGSNSKFLSSDIVTELRGRGDEIRIYPLIFAEFYAAFDGDYDDAWNEYMIYGGLPRVIQFSVERQKAEYLKSIRAFAATERNHLRQRSIC